MTWVSSCRCLDQAFRCVMGRDWGRGGEDGAAGAGLGNVTHTPGPTPGQGLKTIRRLPLLLPLATAEPTSLVTSLHSQGRTSTRVWHHRRRLGRALPAAMTPAWTRDWRRTPNNRAQARPTAVAVAPGSASFRGKRPCEAMRNGVASRRRVGVLRGPCRTPAEALSPRHASALRRDAGGASASLSVALAGRPSRIHLPIVKPR
jgi:hypothetical protein